MTGREKLTAGGSGQGETGAERPAGQCGVGLDVTSFRYWEERNGANIGNGASL